MSSWLALQETPYPPESCECPHCGGQASYQFKRSGTLLTILGQVEYKRAYYLCPECQTGHYPLDQKLGLRPGQMSAELESLSEMTGAQLPFGQGSDLEEHTWRDLKAGAWFTTTIDPPQSPEDDWDIQATHITYYCDIQTAQRFGDLLWATGCQRQAQLADELIFLGDGAEWIWNLVQEHYPEAIQIVDWFHATEYIAPVANVAFTDEDKRQAWIEQVRADLWDGDLQAVINAFERFTEHHRAREPARKAVTYFTNHCHRMEYPTYRAKGYHIGSGTIESGCKQIVTQRLKVAGASWDHDNAIKTAKARAALLSGQWDALTSHREHLSLPLAV